MKLNRKRVLLALTMVACLFSTTACTKEAEVAETIDESSAVYVEQIAEATLQQFTEMTDENLAASLKQAEKSKDSVMVSALTGWESVKEDLGALVSVDEITSELDKEGYLATVNATFEERVLVLEVGINEDLNNYTSITFKPVYTLGENMADAGLNTIIGMGTVFVVLIFISWLIGCFKYIGIWEAKMKAKNAPAPSPAPVPAAAPVEEEEELVDDLELVAVITAAIAASQNTSADGLVVRSIKRKSGAKWKRA